MPSKTKNSPAKKKKKKLSPAELSQRAAQRAFARQVRSIFGKAGFTRIAEAADKEFTFDSRTSDFDDIFVRENVIVCCEHTLTKESNLGDHIKNKAHIYNYIALQKEEFINFLLEKFPKTREAIPEGYHKDELRLSVVYCSKDEVKEEHRKLAESVSYLWNGSIKYFKSITDTVHLSARHELHEFLGLPYSEVGNEGSLPDSHQAVSFSGSLLPEAHSNFPPGYKIVSFYASPGALLSRAYVLRKDGWKDDAGLYQRMIDKSKVENIRKYLKREHRTFVNNVIVTLPDSTKILDINNDTIDPTKIKKTEPVTIQLPLEANSVGIVDGQHRIFSYYEALSEDNEIRTYRNRQNLLATGILYPPTLSQAERSKFEAGLFLEINSTQNAAKSDLKQAIALITAPFSPDSIGKRIIARLGASGPLEGMIEKNFFDKEVLKTTSTVSYGLRPLVRLDGEESLFSVWDEKKKAEVSSQENLDALLEYVAFCTTHINTFLGAVRATVGSSSWMVRNKDNGGLLSVTFINGMLIFFRKLSTSRGLLSFEQYKNSLSKLSGIDFTQYRSSQYNRMAEDMLKACLPPSS